MKNFIKILITVSFVLFYTQASFAQTKTATPITNGVKTLNPIVETKVSKGSEFTEKNVSSSIGTKTTTVIMEKAISTTASNRDVVSNVTNKDGSVTRTTRRVTTTTVVTPKVTTITAPKTVTNKVYVNVITTTITTPRTSKIVNGKEVITAGKPVTRVGPAVKTFVRDVPTTSIIQVSVSRENITTSTDNTPGVLIATEIIPAVVTATGVNGTPTAGYNSNPSFYQTNEFKSGVGSIVKADKAYARGWTGKGVTVAVADTGYATNSTDLKGQVIATRDYTGTGINDTNGHGTFVLGEIVALKNNVGTQGIAYDSKAIVVKIGSGSSVNLSAATQGLAWAADQGAVVGNVSANSNYDSKFTKNLVSVSKGVYRSTDTRYDYSSGKYYNLQDPAEWKAVTDRGMIVVNAAGNQGLAVAANPGYFATVTDASGNLLLGGRMLIVGAADERGNPYAWSNKAGSICQNYITSTSSCADKYKVSDFYLLAPGKTQSTGLNNNVTSMYGTSMAAPIVTGGVALVSQMWPYMKGENVVRLLTTTANKNLPNYDPSTHGQGMLDLDRATQPVGAVGIPTSGRTTSAVNTATLNTSGGTGSALSSLKGTGALSNVMIVDEFSRDFYVNLSQGITVKDKRKISDIKAQQDGLSYLPFQQSYGNFNQGGEFTIIDDLKVGMASNPDFKGDWSSHVTKKFGMSPNFAVRTTLGTMSEQTTWLGNESSGALSVGKNNSTNFAQVGVDYVQDKNKWSIDLGRGYTNVNTTSNSLIKSVDTLQSQSLKIGFEQSLTDTSNWGITTGLPNYITKGSATVSIPYATSAEGDVLYNDVKANLKTKTPEKNLGLYYTERGESDMEWSMRYNAEYRKDVAGETGKNNLGFGIQVERRF
jgi:subtilisin family serine protease